MNKTVYLASPIDQAAGHPTLHHVRTAARAHLVRMGLVVFDPHRAWDCGSTPGPVIQMVNDATIDAAAGLLALLPEGIPSVGVPLEVERAHRRGLPVALMSERLPTAMMGLSGLGHFTDLLDAVDWLADAVGHGTTRRQDSLMVTRLHDRALLPTRAYDGDAGWDLYVDGDAYLTPGQVTDVPTGLAVAIPDGHYGRIVGRSSTHRRRGLSVVEGVIDAGYRGPLFAGVWNPGEKGVSIPDGERLAQLIVTAVPSHPLVEVDSLPESQRGANGFGSSG